MKTNIFPEITLRKKGVQAAVLTPRESKTRQKKKKKKKIGLVKQNKRTKTENEKLTKSEQ